MLLQALSTLLVLLIGLNLWGWESQLLGLVLGTLYLVGTGYLIGSRLTRFSANRVERTSWGVVTTVALISVAGTISFYINSFSVLLMLVVLGVLPWLGHSRGTHAETNIAEPETPILPRSLRTITIALYLSLIVVTWYLVSTGKTTEAIRTPWDSVPSLALLFYALTGAAALAVSYTLRNSLWLTPFYLLTLGLLPLVYPLGFGFDPFIHQASEKLLLASGTITPKPLYYLGQYTLVVTLSQILRLPLTMVDTWALPVLASLSIPLSLTTALRSVRLEGVWTKWLILAPLVFTLPGFTYTTPQGLANLWALLTVLLLAARLTGTKVPRTLLWLLALATLATHPLTGLPIISILLLAWVVFEVPAETLWRKKALALATGASALVVPGSFLIFSLAKPSAASIRLNTDFLGSLQSIGTSIVSHLPTWPQFITLPDAVYLWGRPLSLVFLTLATLGYWYARNQAPRLRFFTLAGALIASGYLVLKIFAQFINLPRYEQDFYSLRLWELGLLCLWPLVLLGFSHVGRWIFSKVSTPLSLVVAGSLILTASFYLTYPRVDVWHRDTAYNTTPADAEAVHLIANAAGEAPYVVLANQAVSAAAIKELGFNKYYAGFFFYPLPTGTNPLYPVYTNATERGLPTREVVREAARLAGVNQVYLVLNRYWADFLTLAPVAAKESNQKWQVADDRVKIFRYDF